MTSPDHYFSPSPEIAGSDDAKELLTIMDGMMRDLFAPAQFEDFYREEVGGWDLEAYEVPSWIAVRFGPSDEAQPHWTVETFRTFDADGSPAVTDDPLDSANNGVGSITFGRRDGQFVQVVVHGEYAPESDDYLYSLELASGSIGVRPLDSWDELPSAEEIAVIERKRQWRRDMDRRTGLSSVSPGQAEELSWLLKRVWARSPYEGNPAA